MVPFSVRPLRIFTLLAVSLAMASLWLNPDLGRPVFVALSIAFIWPSIALSSPVPWPLWRRMWNGTLLIALGPALATWFVAPEQGLRALVALIVLVEMRWAYNPGGGRQARLMLALGAVLVALTCQASESAGIALLAVPFLVVVAGTLLWSEIAMSLERTESGHGAWFDSRSAEMMTGRRIWLPPLRLALASALLGGLLFLLIPRVGTGRGSALADITEGQEVALTGLTSQIELGSFARLLEDPTPAVAVTWLDAPPPQTTYFRESSLTSLVDTGGRWTWRARADFVEWPIAPGVPSALVEGGIPEGAVHQRVEILDPDLRSILAAPWMVGVQSAQGGALILVGGERWRVPSLDQRWPIYEAWSDPGGGMAMRAPSPEASYLPEDLHRRVREFLIEERIVSTLDAPRNRAEAIANHLRTTHRHSLDLGEIRRTDPLEDFIFHPRAGNCEFFASAMAVMCRAVGVPARLVAGFVGGETTPEGTTLFRRSDAHAWVEIWDSAVGWVMIDPTPPQPLVVSADLGLWRHFTEITGSFAGRWREHVVDYEGAWHRRFLSWSADRADQITSLGAGEPGVFHRFLTKFRRNLSQEPVLWWLIGGVLLFNLAVLSGNRWLGRHPHRLRFRIRDRREALLMRLARALTNRPRPRRPGETPAEYLRSLWTGAPAGVTALADQYYRWRHDPTAQAITMGDLIDQARRLGAAGR